MTGIIVTRAFPAEITTEAYPPFPSRVPPRLAVFDFDGTISLVRGGWSDVMVRMMLEELAPLQPYATFDQLYQQTLQDVLQLNGRPTIFQMQQFVEQVRRLGGHPQPAEDYLHAYHQRLQSCIDERRSRWQSGVLSTEELLVPGVRPLLEALTARGVILALLSGTPRLAVVEEVEWLGLRHFFQEHVYAPGELPTAFSKEAVMRRLLSELQIPPQALIGWGDGVVETRNVRELGGLAIGVASDEIHRSGTIVPWKRDTLITAGAHIIIPDYRRIGSLLDWLFAVD